MVDDMPFGQIFHDPTEMRRINAIHRGALTDGGGKEKDPLVGLLAFQPVDEVQLGADRPGRAGRRGADRPNDELGGTNQISLVDDVLRAFGMNDDGSVRILPAEVIT